MKTSSNIGLQPIRQMAERQRIGSILGRPQLAMLCWGVLLILLLLPPSRAWAIEGDASPSSIADSLPIPEFTSCVVDEADMLPTKTEEKLRRKISSFANKYGPQVALLTVPTVGDANLYVYCRRVARTWNLGRDGVDDGALILVTGDTKRIQIYVRHGLEDTLTHDTVQDIIQYDMAPDFDKGEYEDGIKGGVQAVMNVIEWKVDPSLINKGEDLGIWDILVMCIVGFVSVGVYVSVERKFLGLIAAALAATALYFVINLIVLHNFYAHVGITFMTYVVIRFKMWLYGIVGDDEPEDKKEDKSEAKSAKPRAKTGRKKSSTAKSRVKKESDKKKEEGGKVGLEDSAHAVDSEGKPMDGDAPAKKTRTRKSSKAKSKAGEEDIEKIGGGKVEEASSPDGEEPGKNAFDAGKAAKKPRTRKSAKAKSREHNDDAGESRGDNDGAVGTSEENGREKKPADAKDAGPEPSGGNDDDASFFGDADWD